MLALAVVQSWRFPDVRPVGDDPPVAVVVVIPYKFTEAISRFGLNRVPEENRIPLPD